MPIDILGIHRGHRALDFHKLMYKFNSRNVLLFIYCREKSSLGAKHSQGCWQIVRATNSKLLGTKILEVSKTFWVELENT